MSENVAMSKVQPGFATLAQTRGRRLIASIDCLEILGTGIGAEKAIEGIAEWLSWKTLQGYINIWHERVEGHQVDRCRPIF